MRALRVCIMDNNYEENIQTKVYVSEEKAKEAMNKISDALHTLLENCLIKTYHVWILTEEATDAYIKRNF